MSGGSFDYASLSTCLTDLVEKRSQYQAIAEAFEAEQGMDWDDIAAEIYGMLDILAMADRRITARLARLYDVAHSMEWYKSCDYGRDQVEAAVLRLRGGGQ